MSKSKLPPLIEYGKPESKTYNPDDVTITIGGVIIKGWASFEFNVDTQPHTIKITPKTSAEELLKDLNDAINIITKPKCDHNWIKQQWRSGIKRFCLDCGADV